MTETAICAIITAPIITSETIGATMLVITRTAIEMTETVISFMTLEIIMKTAAMGVLNT